MNLDVQDTYLGWRELGHGPDCPRPSWTVDVRDDEHYRSTYGGAVARHSCPNEDCDHDGSYPRTTVRVVCRTCHAAHVISGESGSSRRTTTRSTGFGEAPRRVAGLYLWPGQPWFDDDPHEFLVTRSKPERVRPADVVGKIHEGRGPRGGKQFSAVALPRPNGTYGIGTLRWARVKEGLPSCSAAAKWIAAPTESDGAK
ncbi:hypothetical protein OG369_16160 [Streptomyces sp. NBC_01221]|uniref:hypothetical protein n=1 Tax=Streptomyces sp. NBC_01221 TaxID=2903782 RepID=UPI00225945CF|nr:hypothetical protein [Streptomyces sp. NBC_01221]MCX4787663.1 hypothetical protein [Streptomyces sp. NBC_01221]